MNSPLRIGTTGETRFTVQKQHAIELADGAGMPGVLSTPWLIWFLEHAARDAMLPVLEAGESTVGTHVELEHQAPTPVGQEVVCQARVVHVEGPVVSFQLEAHDAHERIARGLHKRRVISVSRFRTRVERKSGTEVRGLEG